MDRQKREVIEDVSANRVVHVTAESAKIYSLDELAGNLIDAGEEYKSNIHHIK